MFVRLLAYTNFLLRDRDPKFVVLLIYLLILLIQLLIFGIHLFNLLTLCLNELLDLTLQLCDFLFWQPEELVRRNQVFF